MALPKVPINLKTLAKAGKVFEGESSTNTTIEVLVDTSASPELVSLCRKVLEVRPGSLQLSVAAFGAEMPTLNKEASLTIVIAGTSASLRRIMEIALWSGMDYVVLSEEVSALVALVPEEDALEIAKALLEVDASKPQKELEHDLAKWCIAHLPELRLSLGTAFPFMRHPIAVDLTRQTAFENAVISSVFFVPGADLPILTLNQCKLFYQIAVINEVPLSRERLADLAVVIGAAFGFRGLARLVLRKLTPIGWLVRGSIAFGATLTMGHLAYELYSRGGGVVELAKDHMGSAETAPDSTALQTIPRAS